VLFSQINEDAMKAKIIELLKSPHIHISLGAGFSIIVLAVFSKHILPEPIGYLPLAVPPFVGTLFATLLSKYPDSKFMKTWYWVTAVLLATAIVILLYSL